MNTRTFSDLYDSISDIPTVLLILAQERNTYSQKSHLTSILLSLMDFQRYIIVIGAAETHPIVLTHEVHLVHLLAPPVYPSRHVISAITPFFISKG
jgi:hypothetical protein